MSDEKMPAGAEAWHLLALVYGYNELTKLSTTLAERVYFRMARDHAEEAAAAAGVKINRGDPGNVVLELRQAPPFIVFHERDIELMRAAVAAFDVAHAGASPPEGEGASTPTTTPGGPSSTPTQTGGER